MTSTPMSNAASKPASKKALALRILIGLVVLFFAASFAADRVILNQTYARAGGYGWTTMATDENVSADYPAVPYELEVEGMRVQAYLYGADNTGRGLVVFSHGIGSSHEEYLGFIMALVDKGWMVFAYDNIGCGASEGDGIVSLAQGPVTLDAVLAFIESDAANEGSPFSGLPVLLMGHSWGGYTAVAELNYNHNVAAVASLSGFDKQLAIQLAWAVDMMGGFAYTQAPTLMLCNWLDAGGSAGLSAVEGINASSAPVLVVHGLGDEVIAYDGPALINQQSRIARPDVEYLTIANPGHDGHSTFFFSADCYAYLDELNAQYAALAEANGGELSEEQTAQFLEGVDIYRANEANPELMDAIDDFFARALGQ